MFLRRPGFCRGLKGRQREAAHFLGAKLPTLTKSSFCPVTVAFSVAESFGVDGPRAPESSGDAFLLSSAGGSKAPLNLAQANHRLQLGVFSGFWLGEWLGVRIFHTFWVTSSRGSEKGQLS